MRDFMAGQAGSGLFCKGVSPIHRTLRRDNVLTKTDICIFIAVAISFSLGVYLFFIGNREQGIFASSWVPAILCFGIYFKLLVKEK